MKITCSSRADEIRRKRDEYQSRLKAYNEASDAQYYRYDDAVHNKIDPVVDQIRGMLSRFPALHFQVSGEMARGFRRISDGIHIRIQCNDREKFDQDVALAWSWEATVNEDGEIEKSSSSWSGLSACTAAQMESLRQTVAALELLNGIDWSKVLKVQLPKYKDFDDGSLVKPEPEMDYDKELQDAELSEIVGQPKAIRIRNWSGSGYNGDTVWVQIISQTPSMYTVKVRSSWGYGADPSGLRDSFNASHWTVRVRKSSVHPVVPSQIVDL